MENHLPLPALGIIWPDDRFGRFDYELLRLGPWLAAHGHRAVRVAVEPSPAGRNHTRADLLLTGSDSALAPSAGRLAAAGAGAVAWACTSGSFIGGPDWARLQLQALEAACGLPATSATLALIDAARALGADRVDLLSAYPEEITAALQDCLLAGGVEVGDSLSLDCADGAASFAVDLASELAELARRTGPRSRPVLVPDTAINTLDRLGRLEEIAGRPVVTANQAVVWRALALLGVDPTASDAGTLFGVSCPVAA